MKVALPFFTFALAFALAPLIGCNQTTSTKPQDLVSWHDPHRKVTCWVWQTGVYNGAISCLPDRSFE